MTDSPPVEIPRVVSVDDHVMEPPGLFRKWLPAKFRDEGPRVERGSIERIEYLGGQDWKLHFSDDGAPGDYWVYDGKALPMKRINASAGMPLDLRENTPITFDEMRPGCYRRSGCSSAAKWPPRGISVQCRTSRNCSTQARTGGDVSAGKTAQPAGTGTFWFQGRRPCSR